MQTFKLKTTNAQLIAGPAGMLESVLTMPAQEPCALAIVCHPHPLHQGTMHNKIVTTLVKMFVAGGCATLQFNYRGVGASTGEFGNITGECADLASVLQWARARFPDLNLYLAGFSFGSYVAAWGAEQFDCSGLVSIAPPVSRMPFSELDKISCNWLVVQGDSDEVVACADVESWAKSPPSSLKLIVMPGVGHFFHGKLVELRDLLWRQRKDWGWIENTKE